jgi:glycosyltransferase involved in cell wall biosynthesis
MFFSVIIPTRNRPYFVQYAIQSVLRQDFKDFELVISDNSSDKFNQQVEDIACSFNDKRIKYIRPKTELPMGEHWEFALNNAKGDYIGILTDRMVFKKSALRRLYNVIIKNNPSVISYIWDVVPDDAPPFRFSQNQYSNNVIIYKSSNLLYASMNAIFPQVLPRGLNTFCKRSFIEELKNKYGLIFNSISPDYYFCYLILGYLDKILYYDATLSISWGENVSNGTNAQKGRIVKDVQDFLSFMRKENGLNYAPIPIATDHFVPIPCNSPLHEYNKVAKIKGNDKFKPIMKENFYLQAINKIHFMEIRFGSNLKESKNLLEKYRQQNDLKLPFLAKYQNKIINIIKILPQPLLELLYFIACKLKLKLGPHGFKYTTRRIFRNIDEILRFDEKYSRKPSKIFNPSYKILKKGYDVIST